MLPHDVAIADGVVILTPHARRLDAHVAPALRALVLEHIEGGCRLCLDLAHVQFIDSSGLGVVVAALKRLGGALSVRALSLSVRTTFEITTLDRIVIIEETVPR